MRKSLLIVTASTIMAATTHSGIISSWDFNSNPPDDTTRTGTLAPAIGAGTAELVGETTGTFAAGTGSDPGPDNTGWNTATYPPQGSSNKSAGVRFNASTAGYRDIAVSLEQRITGTASRYARLQYTLNGTDFLDLALIETAAANSFIPHSHSLAGLAGASDNPNFGIRFVTEFESSALGQGTDGYVTASSSAYSPSGTIRFDLVTISGEPIGSGDTPPEVSFIPDRSTWEGIPTAPIPFTVGDAQTPAAALVVQARSSNTQLVPSSNIVPGGNGADRTITVTPAASQSGVTVITIRVSDGVLATEMAFLLTVRPLVRLQIDAVGSDITVSWPASEERYRLENNGNLSRPGWDPVSDEPVVEEGRQVVRFKGVSGQRFFRLLSLDSLPAAAP